MDTHYRYISAPSTLNKKELYEEYCKLVEHSKRNDFLLSCEEGRTSKKLKESLKNMVEKQAEVIKCAEEQIKVLKEENKELIECLASLEDELKFKDELIKLHEGGE